MKFLWSLTMKLYEISWFRKLHASDTSSRHSGEGEEIEAKPFSAYMLRRKMYLLFTHPSMHINGKGNSRTPQKRKTCHTSPHRNGNKIGENYKIVYEKRNGKTTAN